jgi:hypothetical protein
MLKAEDASHLAEPRCYACDGMPIGPPRGLGDQPCATSQCLERAVVRVIDPRDPTGDARLCMKCYSAAYVQASTLRECYVCGVTALADNRVLVTVSVGNSEWRAVYTACCAWHLDLLVAWLRKPRAGQCLACAIDYSGERLNVAFDVTRTHVVNTRLWLSARSWLAWAHVTAREWRERELLHGYVLPPPVATIVTARQ